MSKPTWGLADSSLSPVTLRRINASQRKHIAALEELAAHAKAWVLSFVDSPAMWADRSELEIIRWVARRHDDAREHLAHIATVPWMERLLAEEATP